MKLRIRHDLPGTPDEFWAVFFDPDVAIDLFVVGLGATSAEIREQDGDVTTGLTRTLYSEQPVDAPGPVKKLIGDTAGTTEVGTFDPELGVWTFTMTPSTLADKISLAGTVRVEATDSGCVRIFELDGKAKIPLIGKVFEGFIESQAKAAQDKTADFLREKLG